MKPLKFLALAIPAAVLSAGLTAGRAAAQMYNPPTLGSSEVTDTLSNSDIPTGIGGFAKDYVVELQAGDQITIDAMSDEFDTLITLMDADGITVSENDDGPDGTTNSLLFARISDSGRYTVRVRAYAGQGSGRFTLQLARLRPI